MNRSWAVFFAAVATAIGVIWTAMIAQDTVLSLKMKGELSVKGFAKKEIVSDLGAFSATISVEAKEVKACYEALSAAKHKVAEYLRAKGLGENEFWFDTAYLEEKYIVHPRGHATNRLDKYILSQTVGVRSADVAKVSKISSEIVELMGQGVHLSVGRPEYYFTGLDSMKAEMTGLATENAKERASVIAKKGGFRLGTIRSVRVGIFQITPANSTDVSDSGINDNSSIQKEIKSVVEIGYFIR